MSYVKPLSSGKHPTNRELNLMRLGYPEYAHRLQVIRERSPARYDAVMSKTKTFSDGKWQCHRCDGIERYTRNTACCGCARNRVKAAFTIVEAFGCSVYSPVDAARSDAYQQRIERSHYRKYYLRKLSELGEIQCGGWRLHRGILTDGTHRIPFLSPSPEQRELMRNNDRIDAIREHVLSKIGDLPE